MKKTSTVLALLVGVFTLTTFFGNSGGRAGVANSGNTGAPGDAALVCGNCHNSGSGTYGVPTVAVSVATTLGGVAITQYAPGQEYFVTTTITAPMGSPAGYGFQSVYLDDAENSTGTLSEIAAEPTTQVATAANGRDYAEHAGIDADGVFRFKWTAPALGTGPVMIYTVGNTVNSNGSTGGDSGSPSPTIVTLTEQSLPVELTNIDARTEKSKVELTWTTATEENVSHFDVERSTDGETFTTIDQVPAHGSSQVERGYVLTDESAPTGNNFYRLRVVDLDDSFTYSPVVSAVVEGSVIQLGAFPNPAEGMVRFSANVSPETALVVRDGFGRELWTGMTGSGVDLSPYPSGIYLLEAMIDGKRTVERVVKR